MQPVKFRNIEDFLDFLPEDELTITEFLRTLILDCIPDATEKLSYNVPYYRRYKNICFIWPASVLWGKKKTYEGVRFGFTNGHLLTDEVNYLDRGSRKQVYWKDYANIHDIDVDILKAYIYEAVLIDQEMGKGKN